MAAKTDAEFEAMNRDQSAFQLDLYKDALDRLLPPIAGCHVQGGPDGVLAGTTILEWFDERTQPTEAAIQAQIAILKTEYNTNEYSRERKTEYDALNQMELIADDAINGTSTLEAAITAIKTKWPKNNSGPVE